MSNARARRRWFVAGPLVFMGVFTLGAFLLGQTGIESIVAMYVLAACAGFATGTIVALHAPLRATREIPAIVAVATGATLAGLLLVPAEILADGVVDGTGLLHTVLMALAATAASVGGGLAVRRSTLREPSRGMLALISMAVMLGLIVVVLLAFAIGGYAFDGEGGLLLAVIFGSTIVGSFITQSLVSERRVWTASVGVGLAILANGDSLHKPEVLLLGGPICIAIASIGARFAWAVLGTDHVESEPPLPPAQVR